jgi:phenylacetate-CoA ligase
LRDSVIRYPMKNKDLFEQVSYAVNNSKFYKSYFHDYIEDIIDGLTIEKFKDLPFTEKHHLSNNNKDFLAVNKNLIADYSTTSGTSGKPVTIYLTKQDLDRLAENERESLKLMGGTSNSTFQLLTTIDKQFMAGMAYFLGVQKLGAGIIRLGPGSISLQLDSIINNEPDTLIAVPSFINKLITYAENKDIELDKTSVKSIVCIGEPIVNEDLQDNFMASSIKSKWNVELFSTYASSEMQTAFSECSFKNGNHVNEDLIYLEVINESNEHVNSGEIGEVVVTPIGVQGTPLIRYKTGDMAKFLPGICKCGRNSPRIGPIIGRKNELIKFKGTSLYPLALFNIVREDLNQELFHLEVINKELVTVGLNLYLPSYNEANNHSIRKLIGEKLKVTPEIVYTNPELIQKKINIETKRKPQLISFLTSDL